MHNVLEVLDLFSRAGGGGSSSGGGSGEAIILLIGYVPMHFVGAIIRKLQINGVAWVMAQIVGWIICAIFCGLLLFLGALGFFIAIGGIAGMGAGLYGWFSKLKRSKKVIAALQKSASLDAAWNEEAILNRTKELFIRYQADWSRRDWQAMGNYMTTSYAQHAALLVAVLHQAKRINTVQNPHIDQVMIVDARDSDENTEDTVTVGVTASAHDSLIDEVTNKPLFTDNSSFTEYWRLRRQGDTWLLDGIEQATQAKWKESNSLREFAKKNQYFYSLDMGWLFIPARGVLFERARFGTSDINNHIVGIYNNAYLLQLYTYVPVKGSAGDFIIAQTNVPKSYGNIIVRRKKWGNLLKPSGLQKISMEWGDFNKKYEVFASSYEGATSFELLHPAFMEKLEALPLEVNIEVVDNVVYLYTSQKHVQTTEEYEIMLEILKEAYKQMKL
jgi:hypothetical protein